MITLNMEDYEYNIIVDALQKESVSYSFNKPNYPIIKHLLTKLELAKCQSNNRT